MVCGDAVGIANGGIGGGQAGPVRGAAERGFCKAPKRIALADFYIRGTASEHVTAGIACCDWSCGGNGEMKFSTSADLVGVGNPAIGGQQFRPATATAQVFVCQPPERIAGQYAHDFLIGDRC